MAALQPLIILVLFLSSFLQVVLPVDVPVPKYTVNLDLPPEERWGPVVKDYAGLYPLLMEELYQIIPKPIVEAITGVTSVLDQFIPQPYADEIRGIAKYTNSSLGETLMGNLAYDFTAFHHGGKPKRGACTSILALDDNGTLFHGRNLDYTFKDLIRNFTINVEFQRKGQTVFMATTFAGMVGVLTGMRPGGVSISLDQRNTGEIWSNFYDALKTGFHGMVGVVLRETLSDISLNYNDAVAKLTTTRLIAPCFLIIGGPGGEGVVITRDRSKAIDVWHLNESWYLVETNYDHWKPPPASDNRRDPAIKTLDSIGRSNITAGSLFKVLSTPPVLNTGTSYTTVMSCGSLSYYHDVIRYPPLPDS